MENIITAVNNFVWGPVMIAVLVGTGITLTLVLRFIQIKKFSHSIELISGKYDNSDDAGEITHFQALSTALSATIGTGNIAGVATAILAGGPGAVFWMWVTAFFGMATKYSSCLLALKYREVSDDGEVSGGPMYTLSKGLNMKWLGWIFALFTAIASFGIGNMVQANSVAMPLKDFFNVPTYLTGIIIAVLAGMVIVGGIKRIGQVASKIVPFMALIYILGSLFIIISNLPQIPELFRMIFVGAFKPSSIMGGALGITIMQTIRFGVARGVFSNESGLGSAPIAHAAAKTKEPVREGLVAMLGPFIDTIVICTMTALVILISRECFVQNAYGSSSLSAAAYEKCLPGVGTIIVTFGLVFFAFSTIISWSYYGDRCVKYIFGKNAVGIYRWIYIFIIPIGATTKINIVWSISDTFNGLMAIPNLVSLVILIPVIIKLTDEYIKRK